MFKSIRIIQVSFLKKNVIGDEAVISIEFKGEPPFSFTYSRKSLAPPAKKGKSVTTEEESFTITNIDTTSVTF